MAAQASGILACDFLHVDTVLIFGEWHLRTILPAGARVLPFRSDIARLAEFSFSQVDEGYVARAREAGTHVIVAGENYGQGSSRVASPHDPGRVRPAL